MKIAQVCPYDFARPGGVKSHILSLSKYLRLLGHEVKIIAPKGGDHEETEVYTFGSNKSVGIGGTKIDLNIAVDVEKTALKTFLKEEQFDIIHYHTIWNPLLPLQVRRYAKSKHVATFHDTPKSEWVGKTLMPAAAAIIFRMLDQVISVSESQSAYIRKFSGKQIHIIPNGIDLAAYPKSIKNSQTEFIDILFLGRLEERKGVMHALEVFKRLKVNNPALRLLIAGDGDDRAQADAFVNDNHLEHVEFLGFVSETAKLELLQQSAVYLAPALFGESFGIVLLESMATGTPMVGYGNKGYLNVLSPMQREYFAPPAAVDELTGHLQKLINNQQIQAELITEGDRVVKTYDWPLVTQQVLKVYEAALIS